VLAIAPTNGAVAKIIAETKSGLVAHQSEPEKIAQNFLELFKAWENNTNFQPNWYEIQKYNRKEHAKILSELLNKLTQGNF
jgi:hypothetical protein